LPISQRRSCTPSLQSSVTSLSGLTLPWPQLLLPPLSVDVEARPRSALPPPAPLSFNDQRPASVVVLRSPSSLVCSRLLAAVKSLSDLGFLVGSAERRSSSGARSIPRGAATKLEL
jgi:hypothetical protein